MLIVISLICFLGNPESLRLLAYIDPSTGSLVFQAIAASVISGALFFRGIRDRIAWVITGGWRAKPQSDSAALSDTDNDLNHDAVNETHRNAA
jgi:hypothetical protein